MKQVARKTWYPLLLLAVALALPAAAIVHSPDAPMAPPANMMYDEKPGDRVGYLWLDGHWTWDGAHYVWTAGHWIKDRPGYHWIAETWAQTGHKWHATPGHWELNLAPPPTAKEVQEMETGTVETDSDKQDEEKDAADKDEVDNNADATPVKDAAQSTSTKKPTAAAPHHPHRKPVKKPVKPDYTDQSQYPRIIHH